MSRRVFKKNAEKWVSRILSLLLSRELVPVLVIIITLNNRQQFLMVWEEWGRFRTSLRLLQHILSLDEVA
jgi:hypothetical protein